ncbi:hypothetical protein I3760_15G158200 [Carya illinoinensis]|nr:hypothetical protein I3760_15G158200 [Carya illinoinensis]
MHATTHSTSPPGVPALENILLVGKGGPSPHMSRPHLPPYGGGRWRRRRNRRKGHRRRQENEEERDEDEEEEERDKEEEERDEDEEEDKEEEQEERALEGSEEEALRSHFCSPHSLDVGQDDEVLCHTHPVVVLSDSDGPQ